MNILFLDTYYPKFLRSLYDNNPALKDISYDEQLRILLDQDFGTSDAYSSNLRTMGYDAEDLIANCVPLQKAWADENGISYNKLVLNIKPRLLRLPVVGRLLSVLPGIRHIVVDQIRSMRPDVLYCQDLWFLTPKIIKELRPYVQLVVGQTASPLPDSELLKSYDLILTSFPHFVPRLRAMGIAAEYFLIGFDERILDKIGETSKDYDVSFIGGISRHHSRALSMLEYLAKNTPIEFFGYGSEGLRSDSQVVAKHHGEVWGLEMYKTIAKSRIALNRHIDVAENYANNMRLYETTGVGTLLITDSKRNLGELFEIGKEVVVYSSPDEAADKINYYLNNPEEASAIARAGQKRTLQDHTYYKRMEELLPILEHYTECM